MYPLTFATSPCSPALTPPSVFPVLLRFPPCLLTPPCPDWPGLVSTCGPLSAPGPWSLIGPPAPGAGPSLVQPDPHCPGLVLARQSPPWPGIGPLWLHPGKLSSGVQGNIAQWDPLHIWKFVSHIWERNSNCFDWIKSYLWRECLAHSKLLGSSTWTANVWLCD